MLAEKSTVTGKATIADLLERNLAATPQQLRDHRLIVVFMDLSSMQDEDIDRAVDAADDYVNKQMQPADLVALVSLSTGLTMDQDFTSDKASAAQRSRQVQRAPMHQPASPAAAPAPPTRPAMTPPPSPPTTPSTTRLNTDRELFAIRAIAKSLERVDQKKVHALLLRRTQHATASKTRPACAPPPTKQPRPTWPSIALIPAVCRPSRRSATPATAASAEPPPIADEPPPHSSAPTPRRRKPSAPSAWIPAAEPSSIRTTSAPPSRPVQHDSEAYYIVGFKSTNQAQDGSYRHLTIKVNRPDATIQYRPGYYAPADFVHAKTEDRELALSEQLRSDLPATDVSLYLQALYFRMDDNRFFVPVSLIVPGSQIPFLKNGDRDKANLDIIGQVKNIQGIVVGNARETVKLVLDQAANAKQKNIQYSTGFTLAPGRYHLKFVVRENQTGQMGSFETDLNVPDLKKSPLKLSSIVMASQRQPNTQKRNINPLVRDGVEIIPNIPHVFRQDQHLYFLYEVYDPSRKGETTATPATPTELGRRPPLSGIHVLTSIQFMLSGTKVYETPLVEATAINTPDRDAVAFQFDVPLAPLKPGTYVCQINVIDDAGGSFSFPRMALRVTAAPAPPAAAVPVAPIGQQ